MATLAGNTIASTYPLLIKVDSNGLDGTLRTLQDGDATNSALLLATNKVEVKPSAADDAAAFEVSKNDGTPVFTVNTSTAGANVAGTLTASGQTFIGGTTDEGYSTLLNIEGAGGTDDVVGILFKNTSASNNEEIMSLLASQGSDSVGAINIKREANADDAYIDFLTQSNGGSMTERMRITADGEVGINSNNPDEELEVFSKTGGNDVGIKLRALGTSSTAESHVPAISFQSDQGDGVTARASISADRDGGSTTGALIFRTRISDNITEAMRISSSGTSTFTSGSDYAQIRLVDTNTTETTQRTSVNSQHYLSNEEDVRLIGLFSNGSGASATDNIVGIGGGSGSHNAATSIQFYTAANATTVSGSTRLTIKSNGSLVANPGGSGNTAFGEDAGIALNSNTDHNTLFGYQTGKDLVNGDKNVFVGFGAGFAATNTINSVAIGSGALDAVTTGGHYNIAIGTNVLTALTTGEENIAIGDSVGLNMTATSDCVLIGSGAGININHTDADGTVAIGQQALNALTEGNKNLAIGYQALHDVAGGDGNMGIGYQAGASLGRTEFDNIAIGSRAMLSMQENASSSSVDSNIAIGIDAMTGGELGSGANFLRNIAIGHNALNSTGSHGNTGLMAIGYDALTANTSGQGNTAVGYLSGQSITTTSQNTLLGYNAGQTLTSNRNTLLGYQAGVSITSGNDNVCVGNAAGDGLQDANGNVIIGHNSDAVSDSNYANVIGHNITGTATQRSRIGAGSNYVELDHSTSGNNWANTSDVRVKENIVDSDLGLDFVNKLRAVKYEERPKKDWPQEFLSTSGSEDLEEKSQKVFDGFIAQEVKAIVDESKTTFSAWQIDENNKKQQLQYAMFVVPLVKAVQELSAKVTELESKLGE
jgi:hypothetical protein